MGLLLASVNLIYREHKRGSLQLVEVWTNTEYLGLHRLKLFLNK